MINKTDKVEVKRDDKGRFLEGTSGGGRKPGSKNKFTEVKKEIVELWNDADLRGKLLSRLKSSEGEHDLVHKFVKDIILPILPKDPLIVNEGDTHITYVWSGDKDSRDQLQSSRLPEGKSREPSSV